MSDGATILAFIFSMGIGYIVGSVTPADIPGPGWAAFAASYLLCYLGHQAYTRRTR